VRLADFHVTQHFSSTLPSMPLTYAEIEKEFDESLGYIHDDIRALCSGTQTLNYTVALLVGVACEALEDAGASPNRITVLEDLLPDAEWKRLAKPLFDAIRHGLAHNFDTKHIYVNGTAVQIYFSWNMAKIIHIAQVNGHDALYLGTRRLGAGICEKIQKFRTKLQTDAHSRERFRNSLQSEGRRVQCPSELWKVLKNKS
jgi:hypothetical protein